MEIFCDDYASPSQFGRTHTCAVIGRHNLPEETGEPGVVVATTKPKFVFFFLLLGWGETESTWYVGH
jgi:hypothetical protein